MGPPGVICPVDVDENRLARISVRGYAATPCQEIVVPRDGSGVEAVVLWPSQVCLPSWIEVSGPVFFMDVPEKLSMPIAMDYRRWPEARGWPEVVDGLSDEMFLSAVTCGPDGRWDSRRSHGTFYSETALYASHRRSVRATYEDYGMYVEAMASTSTYPGLRNVLRVQSPDLSHSLMFVRPSVDDLLEEILAASVMRT